MKGTLGPANRVWSLIKRKQRERGWTSQEVARKLKVPENSYRQWCLSGRFPKQRAEELAALLDITKAELEKADIGYSRPKKDLSTGDQDILPLLTNIINSGRKSLSGRELVFLFMEQKRFDAVLSSNLIDELLKHR
jgi:transcriptional regulator with XRE-family HTH domain